MLVEQDVKVVGDKARMTGQNRAVKLRAEGEVCPVFVDVERLGDQRLNGGLMDVENVGAAQLLTRDLHLEHGGEDQCVLDEVENLCNTLVDILNEEVLHVGGVMLVGAEDQGTNLCVRAGAGAGHQGGSVENHGDELDVEIITEVCVEVADLGVGDKIGVGEQQKRPDKLGSEEEVSPMVVCDVESLSELNGGVVDAENVGAVQLPAGVAQLEAGEEGSNLNVNVESLNVDVLHEEVAVEGSLVASGLRDLGPGVLVDDVGYPIAGDVGYVELQEDGGTFLSARGGGCP